MSVISYTGKLAIETCWCGIVHAIPENLQRQAVEKGTAVYCPLGHTWVVSETVQAKLERERQRHQATRDLLKAEERSHVATKGALTKARKRAEAALCPHCNRHFTNVERHIKSKHPDCLEAK